MHLEDDLPGILSLLYHYYTKYRLIRPQLAASVTSQGREMILQAKRIAEELSPTNHVIYGGTLLLISLTTHMLSIGKPDTDSIFVNFKGCQDKPKAFKILVEICDAVTASSARKGYGERYPDQQEALPLSSFDWTDINPVSRRQGNRNCEARQLSDGRQDNESPSRQTNLRG